MSLNSEMQNNTQRAHQFSSYRTESYHIRSYLSFRSLILKFLFYFIIFSTKQEKRNEIQLIFFNLILLDLIL